MVCRFIDSIPNCIVIIVLLGLGERDFFPWPDTPIAASCNLLRISPTHLQYLSPYCDTSRVPNHYRLQSSRITKPPNGTAFDSSTPPNGSRKAIIMRRGKKQNPGDLAHPPPPPTPSKEKNGGRAGGSKRHRLLAGLNNQVITLIC